MKKLFILLLVCFTLTACSGKQENELKSPLTQEQIDKVELAYNKNVSIKSEDYHLTVINADNGDYSLTVENAKAKYSLYFLSGQAYMLLESGQQKDWIKPTTMDSFNSGDFSNIVFNDVIHAQDLSIVSYDGNLTKVTGKVLNEQYAKPYNSYLVKLSDEQIPVSYFAENPDTHEVYITSKSELFADNKNDVDMENKKVTVHTENGDKEFTFEILKQRIGEENKFFDGTLYYNNYGKVTQASFEDARFVYTEMSFLPNVQSLDIQIPEDVETISDDDFGWLILAMMMSVS